MLGYINRFNKKILVLKRVFIISCVAKKKAGRHKAADLYTSAWFTKARRLVEATDAPWFILSAEHGLLDPDTIIGPYNKTLNTMPTAERRAWAERVQRHMSERLPDADELIILAGVRYRENLMSYLQGRFAKVTVPMEGLTIGRQLSWMNHATTL